MYLATKSNNLFFKGHSRINLYAMAKILIVDDYQDIVEVLTSVFEMKGHCVEKVLSGENLKSTMIQFRPDIILLDVRFRDMDGRKLCKEIKSKKDLSVPIILMSASPELLKNFKECHADAVMEKPFDLNELVEKVGRVLNKYRSPSLN